MADVPVPQELLIIIGFGVGVAIILYVFNRMTSEKKPEAQPEPEQPKEEPLRLDLRLQDSKVKVPAPERKIAGSDVERARSQIRTLTLKQEIVSLVLRRLYEAEDEGEVDKEERARLAKPYEEEMQQVSEDLKRSEMLVSLAELESIREEMIKKFEESISQTQTRIDKILKELKIEQTQQSPAEEKPKQAANARKRRVIKPVRQTPASADEEQMEEAEEETPEPKAEGQDAQQPAEPAEEPKKLSVEERLSQLKKEVMKELDELDKLELEDKP